MYCKELQQEAERQKNTMDKFFANVAQRCDTLHTNLTNQSEHDSERFITAKKEEEKRQLLEEQDRKLRETEERNEEEMSNRRRSSDQDRDFDIGTESDESMRGRPSRASIGIRRYVMNYLLI